MQGIANSLFISKPTMAMAYFVRFIIMIAQYEYSIGVDKFIPSSWDVYVLNKETSVYEQVKDIMARKENTT